MSRKKRLAAIIVLIVLIPVVGYGLMHGLTYAFPMSEDSFISHFFFTVILIALGLLTSYGILKALSSAVHTQNPREKEFHLKDIAKDKEQLDNSR